VYDVGGNLLRVINGHDITSSQIAYDSLNRPISVTDALNNTTLYRYNALSLRTVVTDANGAATLYQYDGLNRPITITYTADNQVVSYDYDALGKRLVMVDGHTVTAYEYDDLHRLVTVSNPLQGGVGYGYDMSGNRTRLTYPDNRTVAYAHDRDNRLLSINGWDEHSGGYDYDKAGRLITTTLPNGVLSVNQYDDAGRLRYLAHLDGASGILLADYRYQLDGVGNRVVATETLRVPGPYQMLAERLTSSATWQEQQSPAVAYNSQANEYLVVWQDFRNNQWDIYGQRLDGDGALLDGNFLIHSGGYRPAVAYGSNSNRYLVVWDDGEDIWARPLRADGVPGTTFKVYDGAFSTPATQAAVSYSESGGIFAVAWRHTTIIFPGPVNHRILARHTDIRGTMDAVLTVVQQSTDVARPRISAADESRFLVVWQDGRGNHPAIYGRRLQAGQLVGSEFLISDTDNAKTWPDVGWSETAAAYLVVWQNGQAGISGRRVSRAGNMLGDVIALNSGSDMAAPRVTAAGDQWLAVWTLNGPGPGGTAGIVYGREVAADGSLPAGVLQLSSVYEEVPAAAVAGSQSHTDFVVAWTGVPDMGSSFSPYPPNVYSRLGRKTSVLETTVIAYQYDPLYRLVQATYSGAITAVYQYGYDAVGNMTAYTETVGAVTSRVSRTFDAANRLQTSFDFDQGTTSFLYDNNGNLTLVIPPNDAPWQHYTFDQRNLMTNHTLSTGGIDSQLRATFIYDGSSNRLQQTDYTGSTPVTTTYTNDIVGLAQVLVAADGATEVYNLWGLRLLVQDDGQTLRLPLTDGLGSVRVEMVGASVESATTYDPYGNLLAHTGTSGTTYGFTGEQHDEATGLLYLRARYYNPALRSFMGRDPWSGNNLRPQSMNGWSYVDNNPINLTDRLGSFPDYCRQSSSILQYEKCVQDHYGVDPPNDVRYEWARPVIGTVKGEPNCYWGEVPYRAPGYLEGVSGEFALVTAKIVGAEFVYDFATMERQTFSYSTYQYAFSNLLGFSGGYYIGTAHGFRSWRNIDADYSGVFGFYYIGLGATVNPASPLWGIGGATGYLRFWGEPDDTVGGKAWYLNAALGASFPVLDVGGGKTIYSPTNTGKANYVNPSGATAGTRRSVNRSRLFTDILHGLSFKSIYDYNVYNYIARGLVAGPIAQKYADIFDGINYEGNTPP
jgi:RHS repeat-associated protein